MSSVLDARPAFSAPLQRRGSAARQRGWVLLETLSGERRCVVAEGSRPRRFTAWTKSWVARSATVHAAAPDMIDTAIATGEPQRREVTSTDGRPLQIRAVPVLDAGGHVLGVHLWSGLHGQQPPPRHPVGTLTWDPHTSLLTTNTDLERLIDAEADPDQIRARTRALPEFLGHFTFFDRVGFLGLFDAHRAASTWTADTITAGLASEHRRSLYVAARNDGPDPTSSVRALVVDIGARQPLPAPEVAALLAHVAPIAHGHAVGVVDLRTGLIHEWLARTPARLRRFHHEVPVVHPDDIDACRAVRSALLGGATVAHNEFRAVFDDGTWQRLTAQWTILTRETAPQAVLSVQLITSGR
ncbi:GAF domain-containing protein [Nocardia tengchongensis]|uniref:GAF domain-containing protein n=1 Tax=Nocardia tengchongensis TaxID=2055889 RepID=UPI0036AC14CB